MILSLRPRSDSTTKKLNLLVVETNFFWLLNLGCWIQRFGCWILGLFLRSQQSPEVQESKNQTPWSISRAQNATNETFRDTCVTLDVSFKGTNDDMFPFPFVGFRFVFILRWKYKVATNTWLFMIKRGCLIDCLVWMPLLKTSLSTMIITTCWLLIALVWSPGLFDP